MVPSLLKTKQKVQPAYAESFGVASAHLSRRSPAERGEGGTPNIK